MSTLEISLGATPRVTDLPAGTPPSTPALAAGAGIVPGAALGGLLLGYGARIAYGCNIGAYFSGIASSSLHGWIWGITAFAGSILGTHLSFRRRLIARPPPQHLPSRFRLVNPAEEWRSLVRETGHQLATRTSRFQVMKRPASRRTARRLQRRPGSLRKAL